MSGMVRSSLFPRILPVIRLSYSVFCLLPGHWSRVTVGRLLSAVRGCRPMPRFDFNCDMGESFGSWKMGLDAEVIRFVTSANIACGFHAGDPATMRRTVRLAEAHGVGIGAHPGFPDLQGFGRRNLSATPDEVRDDVLYQIGAL